MTKRKKASLINYQDYGTINIIIDPRFRNKRGRPQDDKASHAEWQITARESNWRFDSKNLAPELLGKPYTLAVPESETGYFFQYNGHTAFLINIEKVGDNTTISYRSTPDIQGLKFDGERIIFDTAKIILRIPGSINKNNYGYSIERDRLDLYSKTGVKKDGKALNYSLYMMKGARFKLSGENPDNETGSDFFKLMPDGNVKKIVIVRASSIEGVASDITVPDAFYAGRTKTNKRGIRKPLIIANRNFWIAD